MEEKLEFYEKFLVPVLKKKIYDVQSILSDLEAHVLFLKDKVSALQSENESIKSKINSPGDSYE
jgi:hypothetical protein